MEAQSYARLLRIIGVIGALVISIFMVSFRNSIAYIFTKDEEVHDIVASLYIFLGIYFTIDSYQSV